MNIPAGYRPGVGKPDQDAIPDEVSWKEVCAILTGLERQKEELGPIAEELIDLLHHLGGGTHSPQDQ